MKLSVLLEGIPYINSTSKNPSVLGLSDDSRDIKPGFAFIARQGVNSHGSQYIARSINKGASCIISENYIDNISIPQITIHNINLYINYIAKKFYRNTCDKLKIIGVTGTNGKTSTCFFIAQMLNMLNIKTSVVGTLGYGFPDDLKPTRNTTPGCLELHKIFFELYEQGTKVVVMEISSHALDQGRVDAFNISHALFTNLTQDHLDYHKNMYRYFKTKSILFSLKSIESVSINIDDIYGSKLFKNLKHSLKRIKYSTIDSTADIFAFNITSKYDALDFNLKINDINIKAKTRVIGKFNIYNIMASLSVLLDIGINPKYYPELISNLNSVPGRMQLIQLKNGSAAIIDYAHTPDALDKILSNLKSISEGKIITVFGCGGNRDKQKRPLMGQISESYSDVIILTDDNPRFEKPEDIISDILLGIINKNKTRVIRDRKQAISFAIKSAGPEDIILIAGKGHETYQIYGKKINDFDDIKTVKEVDKLIL